MNLEEQYEKVKLVENEVSKAIVGKEAIINKVFSTILAKGHILIEDIPGVGKTTIATAFSKALDFNHKRMQFTPDVLPSDLLGYNIYNNETGKITYKEGAAVCNLFLADEINRTSSKTQSALLELMEEKKISIDGYTTNLPNPFIVIATQNPVGSIGTQLLPESQLDRFTIRITMGYPTKNDEINILKNHHQNNPLDSVNPILTVDELLELQETCENTFVHDAVYDYIVRLADATRTNEYIELGLSPRGTLSLVNLSRAIAFTNNRNYVLPEDIAYIFSDVAVHRIVLTSKAKLNHISAKQCIEEILSNTLAPKLHVK